jgi:hypothetical protein
MGDQADIPLPAGVALVRFRRGDVALFCFGEIDVRCHIKGNAAKHPGGLEGMLREMVGAYLDRIMTLDVGEARRGVVSVCPPNPSRQFCPNDVTDRERVAYTSRLNALLSEGCTARGIDYVDIHSSYAGHDGMLPVSLAEPGGTHIWSTDRVREVLRGMGMLSGKVISYAWFRTRNAAGRSGFFAQRVPAVLRSAFALFPDWQLVIHHDEHLFDEPYYETLRRLQLTNRVVLVNCGPAERMAEAMLWRLKPLFSPGVTHVMPRDLDSLATPRERWTVETWLRSGAAMHIINDSPAHVVPSGPPFMLGGMVGFNVSEFLRVTGISSWDDVVAWGAANGCNMDGYGGDQDVMNKMFHPLIGGNYYRPSFADGKAQIDPEPVDDVDQRALAEGWRYSEFIGHVFSNIDAARAFYDTLPSSAPIIEAETRVIADLQELTTLHRMGT